MEKRWQKVSDEMSKWKDELLLHQASPTLQVI